MKGLTWNGLDLMACAEHPNRVPFSGVLTFVDEPSDKAPTGGRRHRLLIKKEAAQEALHTLIGMAVNFSSCFKTHNAMSKCGVITGAHIAGKELRVEGFVYGKDFPVLIKTLNAEGGKFGMSYESANNHVTNLAASIWEVNKLTFTGAAILHKEVAAYSKTTFQLV